MNITYFIGAIYNNSNYLFNPTLLNKMIAQILFCKRIEWMRYVLIIKPYTSIRDFADWIREEARLISLVASTYSIPNKQNTTKKRRNYRKCILCKSGKHSIHTCKSFKQKSISERWNLVKKNYFF